MGIVGKIAGYVGIFLTVVGVARATAGSGIKWSLSR